MPRLTQNMFQVSGQASNILCMWLAAEFKFVHANGMFNAKSESLCVACHERKCLRIAPCPYHAISGRQSTDLPANLSERKRERNALPKAGKAVMVHVTLLARPSMRSFFWTCPTLVLHTPIQAFLPDFGIFAHCRFLCMLLWTYVAHKGFGIRLCNRLLRSLL